ncbi:MAG: hypothetical protein ACFCUE_04905 [Candidatus Bathyarchaeia archaeon]
MHRNLYNKTTNQTPQIQQNNALSLNLIKHTYENHSEGKRTPKKGYKSITVKAEVYDYYYNQYLKVKEDYALKKGIQSFSSYITYILFQLIEEEKKKEKNP